MTTVQLNVSGKAKCASYGRLVRGECPAVAAPIHFAVVGVVHVGRTVPGRRGYVLNRVHTLGEVLIHNYLRSTKKVHTYLCKIRPLRGRSTYLLM